MMTEPTPTWTSDQVLRDIAYELGRKILEMYDKAGITISVPVYPGGAPSPNARSTFIQGIVHDAEDYLSLDPANITEAYFTLQRMAEATAGKMSLARANIHLAGTRLAANWHGDAADEFSRQLFYIEGFMDTQQDYYLYAVQALGISFSLAVQVRTSFYDLAESSINACDKIIQEQVAANTEAKIGLGLEIVQAGIDLVNKDKLKDVAEWGVGKILAATGHAVTESLHSSEAPQVVENYSRGRNKLRGSYEAGLFHLRDWLNRQQSELNGSTTGLVEPLKPYCDIDSPDFSYDKFFNENHSPDTFGSKVEQEHQKHLQEKQQEPTGIVAQRLGEPE